jgi:hypothetical protein
MTATSAVAQTIETPPKELSDYNLDVRDVVFRTLDKKFVLRMTLSRNHYKQTFGGWTATCGLFIYLGPEIETDNDALLIRVSHWWHSDDDNLARIVLTGGNKGFRLTLPNAEVCFLAFEERGRLLEFLGQLRGVELHYTADIFGFLRKDGSDKAVVTPLPFPISQNN